MDKSTQTSEDNIESVDQKYIIMRGLRSLREDEDMVDVTLVVNGIKLQPCHKLVLAASSSYFRAMFTHGMLEQDKKEIEISGVEVGAMKSIIEYLYTGDILINESNVQSLTTASSLMQIIGVYGLCKDYICGHLDLQNCIEVYKFARALCCKVIENEAFDYILRKFKDVCKTAEFLTLDKEEIINIISSDNIWVSNEEVVYEATLCWVASDINNRGKHAVEVLSYVRFVLLDKCYLEECIIKSDFAKQFPKFNIQVTAALDYLKEKEVKRENNFHTPTKVNSEDNQENGEEQRKSTEESVGTLPPSYCVEIPDTQGGTFKVNLPLICYPRAGMCREHLLLLTNGRKTYLFDPIKWKYYGETQMQNAVDHAKRKTTQDGFCGEMPVLKNPEAYATSNGDVFLMGGLEMDRSAPGVMRRKIYLLQPDIMKWKVCESQPLPRVMAAYGDIDDEFYVIGGKPMSGSTALSRMHKYNRLQNTWTECANLPEQIYGHGSASFHNNIYVIGGKNAVDDILCSTYMYNGESESWTTLSNFEVPRYLHGCTVDAPNGLIYVVAGSNDTGVLNSVEIYNCNSNSWSQGPTFPENRCAQSLVFLEDKLLAVGGYVTTRTEEGRYESTEQHDIYLLQDDGAWERIVRHITGTLSTPCACVGVYLNPSRITSGFRKAIK